MKSIVCVSYCGPGSTAGTLAIEFHVVTGSTPVISGVGQVEVDLDQTKSQINDAILAAGKNLVRDLGGTVLATDKFLLFGGAV